ncbi:MAG: phosphate acyltransferase PlsX [Anaerolineae bacterium]|nr:phosphate acyltransferase PlsX [Anaerolineae bacterium]
MRIVVDAFGSDQCPGPDVEGAVLAAREWGDEIILVGPAQQVREELAKHDTGGLNIRIVDAPEVLTMEHHADDVRRMENSSIRVGMRLVKEGEAEAFVSAGNTIAVLSAAIFDLRRIRGIRRPALATRYPVADRPVLLLDIGATADPKPEYLLQFARMGAIYAEQVMAISNPRVGLLANGEEAEKGSMVVRDTYHVLKESDLNFVGNVEPKEVARGHADVVVTDGFTGNILVKTSEAVVSFVARLLKRELLGGALGWVGLVLMLPGLLVALPGILLLLPGILRLRKRTDYAEYGGALLMGVDGVVIVGHGRSNARAVKNAIRQGREAAAGDVIRLIKSGLQV